MNNDFLKFEEIPIGSWWAMASGSKYGYCVTGKDARTSTVFVLSTAGEIRTIDYFKLQYRYKLVVPNV